MAPLLVGPLLSTRAVLPTEFVDVEPPLETGVKVSADMDLEHDVMKVLPVADNADGERMDYGITDDAEAAIPAASMFTAQRGQPFKDTLHGWDVVSTTSTVPAHTPGREGSISTSAESARGDLNVHAGTLNVEAAS